MSFAYLGLDNGSHVMDRLANALADEVQVGGTSIDGVAISHRSRGPSGRPARGSRVESTSYSNALSVTAEA